MICTITSCIAKVAANGNHYLDIVAQPADAWSEPITYRLFGSAERCAALSATPPKTINLGKVQAKVRSYAWIRTDGTLSAKTDVLSVTCRFSGEECCDDATRLAEKYLDYLIEQDKVVLCDDSGFDGMSSME